MSQEPHSTRPRSLAVYERLLRLYPRACLRFHREELLQNFQDIEQELPSRAALWCFIAKDLIFSARSEFMRTFWGQTSIAFAVLSLILAVAHLYPGKRELYIWGCSVGYAIGWFGGWFGWHWQMTSSSHSRSFVRSFWGQGTMLLCAILIVLMAANLVPNLDHLMLASCYGLALAWITGWTKNKRRMRL